MRYYNTAVRTPFPRTRGIQRAGTYGIAALEEMGQRAENTNEMAHWDLPAHE